MYESIKARQQHRPPADLYHTALVVTVPEGRYVIEDAWPIPDDDNTDRGVVLEGPVFSRRLGLFRLFRYEVRRWKDGKIADADYAVESPLAVSEDAAVARRILDLLPGLPVGTWGRDEAHLGDMWNSNSVIAWALQVAGVDAASIIPPRGGRAPGWASGIAAANGHHTSRRQAAAALSGFGTTPQRLGTYMDAWVPASRLRRRASH